MSYIYSKFESKKVYADPEGTISRYQVECTNNEKYDFKNNGFLMLYLTRDKFIIRSFYNPDIFRIKGRGQVYFEIPFSSVTAITCCGEDISQIISLSDFFLFNVQKSNISIEFKKEDNTLQKLDFSIRCYISLKKNVKEILIPITNIVSLTHEQNFKGSGTALSQCSSLKLVYKDSLNK